MHNKFNGYNQRMTLLLCAASARHGGKTFPAARRGVAAMEFGILAPVMALLLVGVFNLAKITILWEQVWSASESVAESATTLAIQPDGSAKLTYLQANLALSETFAEIPWVAAGIANGPSPARGQNPPNTVTAVLSSINYVPPSSGCQPNCSTYASEVMWSKAYVYSGFNSSTNARRTCGTALSTSSPTVTVGGNLLNNSISAPDPFLMADVSVKFTPYLFSAITGTITLSATSYVPVRSNVPGAGAAGSTAPQYATFDDTGDPTPAAECNITGTSASG